MTTHLRSGRDWQLFLTTAIENANDAVILYEVAGEREPLVINYVNRMFEEQTGYSREEAIGQTRELLFGPETDPAATRALRDAIRRREPASAEVLKYRKDGSTYWAEVNIRPLLDETGTMIGAVAIERDVTRRKEQTEEHERVRALFDAIMANTKNVVFVKDLDGRYIYVNEEYRRLHEEPGDSVIGKSDFDIFPAEMAASFRENDRRALCSGGPLYEEELVVTRYGPRTYLTIKFPLLDGNGRAYAVCGMATNIHSHAEMLQRLHILEFALDHARDAIAIYRLADDGAWRIHYANEAMSAMTGREPGELIGQTSDLIIGPATDEEAIRKSREQLKDGHEVHAVWLAYRKDGSTFWTELNATPLSIENEGPSFTVVVYRDITKKKEHEEQLSYEASHDPLTGVFNRRYLERSLELAVDDARSRESEHGLIVLDLDGFKAVNDVHGHEAGDKLLVALSILMASRLRRGDVLARLGGDEFAVLLLGCSVEQSQRLASELLDAIDGYSYPLGEHRLSVTASAGVTVIDSRESTPRELLRAADGACYAAKRAGKNRALVAGANG